MKQFKKMLLFMACVFAIGTLTACRNNDTMNGTTENGSTTNGATDGTVNGNGAGSGVKNDVDNALDDAADDIRDGVDDMTDGADRDGINNKGTTNRPQTGTQDE